MRLPARPKFKLGKSKRPRSQKPLGAWQLFRQSLAELRQGWKSYLLVVAVISVPLNLLAQSPAIATNAAASAYAYMAIAFMNIVALWVVIQRAETGASPRLAAAYYDGSAGLLRYLLTLVALVFMLIPAIIGTVIYLIGSYAVEGSGTVVEVVLISLVGFIVALPTFWMLTRYGLAPLLTVAEGKRPIAALRYSRFLTLGRFWRVLGRYIALFMFIVLLDIPVAIITAGLGALKLPILPSLFFAVASTLIAVPFANIYLYKFMRNLETGPATPAEIAESAPTAETATDADSAS